MQFVVLVDHGISWGVRDIAPVGFDDRADAEEFADEARDSENVDNAYVLDLIDQDTYFKQRVPAVQGERV